MKGTDDFGVLDAGELSTLLGEASDIIPQGLVRLLTAPSEIPRIARTHVCALEVAYEGPDQVRPVADLVGMKMLEPCSCRVRKMQRKVANDDGIVSRTAQLARQAVVVESEPGIRLPEYLVSVVGCRKRGGKGAARISRLNTRVSGGSSDGVLSSLRS